MVYKNLSYTEDFSICEGPDFYPITEATLHPNTKIIEKEAFIAEYLEKISLNEGLEIIKEDAFASCNRLSSIIFPDSLMTIEENAFGNCKILKDITFGKNLKEIKYYAFSSCEEIENIDLSKTSLLYIGQGTFAYCKNLKEVKLPNSLIRIESSAFIDTSIKSLIVPKYVTFIGDRAFQDSKIEEIRILSNNIFFSEKALVKMPNLKVIYYNPFININALEYLKEISKKKGIKLISDVLESLLNKGKSFKEINKEYNEYIR